MRPTSCARRGGRAGPDRRRPNGSTCRSGARYRTGGRPPGISDHEGPAAETRDRRESSLARTARVLAGAPKGTMAAMGTLVVRGICSVSDGITAHIDLGERALTASFRVPVPVLGTSAADAVLAMCLLPAMSSAAALRIDAPVSARLIGSLPTIQDVVTSWRQR